MADITQMAARSGKVIRSDNTIVNEADGINDDGSRRVQLTGSLMSDVHYFHNRSSTTGNGIPFINDKGYKTLIIDITSKDGNTSRELKFVGIMNGADANYLPLLGCSYTSPIKNGVSTTEANERWAIDISGMDTVEIRLTSITGGSIVVCGKAVM